MSGYEQCVFTSCTEGVPICILYITSIQGLEKKERYSVVYWKNAMCYELDLKTTGTNLQKVTRGVNTVVLQSCGAWDSLSFVDGI
jgi:hypothetical protein